MGGLDTQYIHIKPRIIAEKFIENDGGDLYDYKIFCFDGVPKIILHIEERYTDKDERMFFYDTDWNLLPFNINVPLEKDVHLPRPENLADASLNLPSHQQNLLLRKLRRPLPSLLPILFGPRLKPFGRNAAFNFVRR